MPPEWPSSKADCAVKGMQEIGENPDDYSILKRTLDHQSGTADTSDANQNGRSVK